MDSVIHFEVTASDPKRAQKFYEEVFGWKAQPMPEMNYTVWRTAETDDKGMIKKPGAINGGMMKKNKDVKSPTIVMNVKDIDESLKHIVKLGGKIIKNKVPVGDMGFMAYFKDTEDNVMGLWQNKGKAQT